MSPEERKRSIITSQQSDLWLASRVGRITGSRLGDVMAPPTTRASTRKGVAYPAGSEALAKEDYRRELVVERIYRRHLDHFVTRAMQDGIEREPFARMLYEADTSQIVELVGFALHPEWDWFGASADGLCGEDGGVELKCPTDGVHDSYAADPQLLADTYQWQCLGCLVCFPEREWWDLVSFSPNAPDSIKLVQYRFHRETWKEVIDEIEKESELMHEQIEAEIARRGLPPTVFDIMPKD
jgi:YqaJ-like recombinase protein